MWRLMRRRREVEAEIAGEAAAAAAVTVTPTEPDPGGRLLRRRQHDDARRLDLPLRPRPGRPRTVHHRRPAQVRLAAGPCSGSAATRTRAHAQAARPRWRSSRAAGRRVVPARRGDLRRADGRAHLGRHPRAGAVHLDAGQRVWLVTAAPVELAAVIAQRLGLTGALGTVAETATASTPGGWSATCCTARPRRRRSAPWPTRGPRPDPLRRLQRLGQRPADAVAGRPAGRGQP